MLVAIIWGLVVVAAAFLAIGFFLTSSNVWLILAIVFAIGAIVLVLASWAGRARQTSASIFDDTISFGDGEEGEGEDDDEELYSALDTDTAEEFAVGSRRPRPARRPAARKSGAKPARKPAAKAKAKPKAKPSAAKSKSTRAKSTTSKATASKSTAKRKPAAKPAKAKPTSRPKAKPTRRRPPAQ